MPREESTIRLLRASRAIPPHKAGESTLRRSLYGASLEQFEQLLRAAEAVGPAAQPLPMFYALSQAGRAIVAARGADPEIRGHGLAEDQSASSDTHLLHRRVKRRPAKDGRDAFGAVSRAIGSPEPKTSLQLGEIWVGLPDTFMVPQSLWHPDWRQVLVPFDSSPREGKDGESEVQVASFGGNPHKDEKSTIIRERYPSLPPDTKLALKGGNTLPPGNWIVVLSWDSRHDYDTIAPKDPGMNIADASRRIRPTLAGDDLLVNPLMLWWALIFGLSIFARYHPNLWLDALQVDSSEIAVPLEAILDRALTAIPTLVHHELLGV